MSLYNTTSAMPRLFRFLVLTSLLWIPVFGHSQIIYRADSDTSYQNSSGLLTMTLDSNKLNNLTRLGMLWGFIKYYHAGVKQGEYNMDAELFRELPKVLAAQNREDADNIMETWIDHFGIPISCPNCRMVTRTDNVKLSPDFGYLFDAEHFSRSLINKLLYIRNNRDTGYHHYYAEQSFSRNATFMHERAYQGNWYPDAGLRLLAVYRYWNIIRYYFPYRHLIGADWNNQLSELIVSLNKVEDTGSYIMACRKMVATIHDGHANISGENNDAFIAGNRLPPIKTMFIGGQLVIVGYDDTLDIGNKIEVGDIIEQIDNVPVAKLVQQMLPFVSGSNYSYELYVLSLGRSLLLNTKKPFLHVVINHNGQLHDAYLPTQICPKPPYGCSAFPPPANDKGYKMLSGNIGYVYPANLFRNSTDTILQLMKNSKGLIVDMRCYPHGSPLNLIKMMKCSKSPFEISSQMAIDAPGMFEYHTGPWLRGCDSACYHGKVVIIVNQATISQAEFTTMGLATIEGSIVIGDTTAGADGDVSLIPLPGGLKTRISGTGVLYPDGRETQRVGVKIDKVVRPTIEGIRAGKDEQLEAAIKIIEEQ